MKFEEVERADGAERCLVCAKRSTIVGEHAPPSREVHDSAFNDVANSIDCRVELFLSIEQLVAGGRAEWDDGSGSGSETCISSPSRSQTNWWEWPVVLCLPDRSPGALAHDQHGHSDPSTMPTRPCISSARSGTNSSSTSAMTSSRSLIARETVDWSTNNNSARVSCRGLPTRLAHVTRSSIRATSSSNCSEVSPVVASARNGLSGREDSLAGTFELSHRDHCSIHYNTLDPSNFSSGFCISLNILPFTERIRFAMAGAVLEATTSLSAQATHSYSPLDPGWTWSHQSRSLMSGLRRPLLV